MNRSPLRAFLLIPLVLACFALSPQARAVCQEGCLANQNTVLGEDALFGLTRFGFSNTAIGFNALYNNTSADSNTAVGYNALLNTTSGANTAVGSSALEDNTTGSQNTALGFNALHSNTTGGQNTATGQSALSGNITGSENTAVGYGALVNNEGNDNTAIGHRAMELHRTGDNNTAIGQEALRAYDGNYNTAIGQNAMGFALGTGNNNIALGNNAGKNLTAGDNNIFIGNFGLRRDSNTIRIGTPGFQTATYVAGISGATVPDGVAVIVGADGHLGTTISSARYKEAIEPMDKASEGILALKPVTFHYKHELDPDGIPQFGLVAEDVEKVNPDLVARDDQGKPYTVRYEAVNAMLLNEFLKEHQTVQELKSAAVKQEAMIARQQKQIDALTAGLQKVSAQLEVSKSAPQTVVSQ